MFKRQLRDAFLVGIAVVTVAMEAPTSAICPDDPEIMCGIECKTSGPNRGWCWDEAAGACLLVVGGNISYGCIGGFYHCSCDSSGGG